MPLVLNTTEPTVMFIAAFWIAIFILAGAVSSTSSVSTSSATAATFSKEKEPLTVPAKPPTATPKLTVPPSFRTSVV